MGSSPLFAALAKVQKSTLLQHEKGRPNHGHGRIVSLCCVRGIFSLLQRAGGGDAGSEVAGDARRKRLPAPVRTEPFLKAAATPLWGDFLGAIGSETAQGEALLIRTGSRPGVLIGSHSTVAAKNSGCRAFQPRRVRAVWHDIDSGFARRMGQHRRQSVGLVRRKSNFSCCQLAW
jgi:hypothetical protein